MPIRQRGPSWQVDVRLPDGKRYRTTVQTEADAKKLEAELQTNPQQRRALKKLLKPSPGATKAGLQPLSSPSENAPEASGQPNSTPATSHKSAVPWPANH